ncbi:hypothetical protein HDU81_007966 [Chytriomyces hyalinus]|nr:hypothetical protein HDU81_007966 [Chytriomyces hyalinus]
MIGDEVNGNDAHLIQHYATVSRQVMELIPYETELKSQVEVLQALEANGPSRIAAVKAAGKKVADAKEHLDGAEGMFVMNREKERSKRREVYAANQHAEKTAIDIMTAEIEQLNVTSLQVSELGRKIEFLQSKREQLNSIVSKIFSIDPDREETYVSKMLDKAVSSFFRAHKEFAGIRDAVDTIEHAHKVVKEHYSAAIGDHSNTFALTLYYLALATQSWPKLREIPIPPSIETSSQATYVSLGILVKHLKFILDFLAKDQVVVVANVRKCYSNVIGAAKQAHSVRYKVLELRKQIVLGENYPAQAEGEISALLFRVDLEYLEKVASLDVVVKDETPIGKAAGQICEDSEQPELGPPVYA